MARMNKTRIAIKTAGITEAKRTLVVNFDDDDAVEEGSSRVVRGESCLIMEIIGVN